MTKCPLLIAIGLSTLLIAADDEPRQKAIVTKTERFDVPPGAALRLTNSIGQLTIEGWDEPAIEITTIKSSKEEYDSTGREKALQQLGRVQVTSALRGDEFVIESKYPKYPRLERPFRGLTYFDLEYRIKAPRNTTLTIDHDSGQIFVDDMTGNIHATDHLGDIELHLPQDAVYDIDAKAKIGAVNSDFAGHDQSEFFHLGTRLFHDSSPAPRKLYLRVGAGDVVLLKIRTPAGPPDLHSR